MNLKSNRTICLFLLLSLLEMIFCKQSFLGKSLAENMEAINKTSERMLIDKVAMTYTTNPGTTNCRLVEVCEMVSFPRIGYKEVCRNEYRCE